MLLNSYPRNKKHYYIILCYYNNKEYFLNMKKANKCNYTRNFSNTFFLKSKNDICLVDEFIDCGDSIN
jgi:hypothetical protein